MNKTGLFGLFFWIVLTILIIGVFVGISINQAYSTYKDIKSDSIKIKEDVDSGNCSRLENVKERKDSIFSKIDSVCKNPLLRYSIEKIEALPFSCKEKEKFKENIDTQISELFELCSQENEDIFIEGDFSEEEIIIEELD